MSGPQTTGEVPIACLLDDAEQARREAEIASEIFADLRSVKALSDGYAFEFPPDMAVAGRLIEFIGFERRCCPFFTFELIFQPAKGPIWLQLTGPEGVKSVIEEMLPTRPPETRREEEA